MERDEFTQSDSEADEEGNEQQNETDLSHERLPCERHFIVTSSSSSSSSSGCRRCGRSFNTSLYDCRPTLFVRSCM